MGSISERWSWPSGDLEKEKIVDTQIYLQLPQSFVNEILIELDSLVSLWESTAEYLETGFVPEDHMVADCSSESEAIVKAESYRGIVRAIQRQLELQSS
jgi:hypothetical protein